jgi:hypothetical protein
MKIPFSILLLAFAIFRIFDLSIEIHRSSVRERRAKEWDAVFSKFDPNNVKTSKNKPPIGVLRDGDWVLLRQAYIDNGN